MVSHSHGHDDDALLKQKNFKIYSTYDFLYCRRNANNEMVREAYASNIIIIETSEIKEEFKKLQESGAIIMQNIDKSTFPDKEFIKDHEDNTIVYLQKNITGNHFCECP